MAGVPFPLSILRFLFPRYPCLFANPPTHIYLPVYHHALLVLHRCLSYTTTRPITARRPTAPTRRVDRRGRAVPP